MATSAPRVIDEAATYVSNRLKPRRNDVMYLHLADLLVAMRDAADRGSWTVLDFGAGFSPYRSLFPNSDYRRADIAATLFQSEAEQGGESLDYVISADGRVPEADGTFDIILSTQVAEHLVDFGVYLSECHRLLKPGGRLILTTHGLFEDHACPHDYQRWTVDGLKRDLTNAGFVLAAVRKLTAGPRAIVFLIERYLASTRFPKSTLRGFVHGGARMMFRWFRLWIHSHLDRHYSAFQVVRHDQDDSPFYIAVFVDARRPAVAAASIAAR